jgi:hypothetical protein
MANLPALPLIGGALFIDNSGWMEGMNTCYRYLQFRNLNLRVSTGEKPALNFGSAIHMALELRYSLYGNKPVDQRYYDDVATILTEFFDQHPPPSEDWRTLNWAMETIKRYNGRYEQEEFNLLRYVTPIDCPHCIGGPENCLWCRGSGKREYLVELPFSIPLYTHKGIPIIYSGRIDLPIMWQGDLWSMDTKTTGQLGDMFWNEQRISAQHRGYCWALRKLGHQAKGYIVNAIRSKEPPQYVMNGAPWKGRQQTPAMWWNESLLRDRQYLQENELEVWERNTIDLCEEFFWHYERDYMPMKTKWCSSYGKCPYYDVCKMVPSEQPALLASGFFTPNVWTPLAQPTQSKQ